MPATSALTSAALARPARRRVARFSKPQSLCIPTQAGKAMLALPFDALRAQYALAVQAGLAERSLLASGRVERALDSLEKLVLGPLARRV